MQAPTAAAAPPPLPQMQAQPRPVMMGGMVPQVGMPGMKPQVQPQQTGYAPHPHPAPPIAQVGSPQPQMFRPMQQPQQLQQPQPQQHHQQQVPSPQGVHQPMRYQAPAQAGYAATVQPPTAVPPVASRVVVSNNTSTAGVATRTVVVHSASSRGSASPKYMSPSGKPGIQIESPKSGGSVSPGGGSARVRLAYPSGGGGGGGAQQKLSPPGHTVGHGGAGGATSPQVLSPSGGQVPVYRPLPGGGYQQVLSPQAAAARAGAPGAPSPSPSSPKSVGSPTARSPANAMLSPKAGANMPRVPQSGDMDSATLKVAQELLADEQRERLKSLVVECFRYAESKSTQRTSPELTLNELYTFKAQFVQKTGIPDSLFKDINTDYVRFDFSGTGLLSVNEIYKLIKFYLYAALRKAGVSKSVGLPITSLEAAGYRNLREVGKGAQGTVYFCQTKDGTEKCVKSYKKDLVSLSGFAELKEEFEAMKLCACDRVAQAFEIFQDNQFYYMVGEAYHGGDFQTLKARANNAGVMMDESWWRGVFRQCLEGIVFMHEQAMMHCDLKEPNLMLRTTNYHDPEVVIIDLGLSKATVGKARTGGTPGYIPPETLDRGIWFPKGDVFSMGVCVIQIIIDKIPPTGARTTATPGGIFVEGCRTVDDIAHATKTRAPPFHSMPAEWPEMRKWTQRLLQKDIRVRPTAQQALEDPWFTKEFRSRTRTGFTKAVNARNRFATDGITNSVLVRIDNELEELEDNEEEEEEEAVAVAAGGECEH